MTEKQEKFDDSFKARKQRDKIEEEKLLEKKKLRLTKPQIIKSSAFVINDQIRVKDRNMKLHGKEGKILSIDISSESKIYQIEIEKKMVLLQGYQLEKINV